MKRRGRWLALLGGCLLLAVTWLVCLALWPARTVRLENGSFVTVVGVTYGKEHQVKLAKRWERLTAFLPAGIFPKWPRPLVVRTNTPEKTLIVWLCATNIPASYNTYGGGFVAGSDGVELETCRFLFKDNTARHGWIYGLAVDALPRCEKNFTLRLRNVYSMIGNTKQPIPLGEIVFSNPRRSRAKPWRGLPAPQRVVTKEFECELNRCELNLATLLGTPLRLEWRFHENGKQVEHWKVQRMELEDASGNLIREQWWDGPASERTSSSAGWVRRSLYPGSGAWKVRAYVARVANFRPDEQVEVRNLPVPLQPGYPADLWRTNISDDLLEVGSFTAWRSSQIRAVPLAVSSVFGSREDRVMVLFGSSDLQQRTRFLSLEDDRGRPGRTTETWKVDQAMAWGREWDADATSCTMRLGVSDWRVVEFLVEPTVIDKKP